MNARLQSLSKRYPAGVIIPVIDKDVNNPAFKKIIDNLNECTYLKKVYLPFLEARMI